MQSQRTNQNGVTNQNGIKNRNTGARSLALVLTACALTGCGRSDGGGAAVPMFAHLYAGIDVSGSVGGRSGASVMLTENMATGLTPGRDALTVYRMDRETCAFFDQPMPASVETLQDTMVAEVEKVQEMNAHAQRYGTFPAKFWHEVSKRASQEQGAVAVVLFTDGENSDQRASSKETIRQAAQALAGNPHVVSVSIYGADSGNFAYLHQCLDALGSRLHLYGPQESDVQPVLDSLQQIIPAPQKP